MEGRRCFVGGNWKSNGTRASVTELVEGVLKQTNFDTAKVEVVVAPTFIHLDLVRNSLDDRIAVAAQNCSTEGSGAFTGEIAAEHLKDFGIPWVIIGHSERRTLYGETDATVAKKVTKVLGLGLSTILCIGETKQERDAELTIDVVTKQLSAVLSSISDWSRTVIAYEPVWAIGTGVVATTEQAQEVHGFIRNWIATNASPEVAASTRIIYGGSVTDSNAGELISQPDIDGFLVGGASLRPGFKTIVEIVSSS
jgi:triosephosphate isomerase